MSAPDGMALSEHELKQRYALYDAFRSKAQMRDPRFPHIIHASDFQAVLESMGLAFGHEVVDRVMLLCKIDEHGMVDFSRFEEDVLARRHAAAAAPVARAHGGGAAAGAGAPAPAPASAAAGRGLEFHRAIEQSLGRGLRPDGPEDPFLSSQGDRVRALSGKINALFQEFDTGRTSLDVFREQLRDLGLRENPEVDRLLRQTPVSFSALLKALTYEGHSNGTQSPSRAAGAASLRAGATNVFTSGSSAVPLSGRGRSMESPTRRKDQDPIAWRDGPAPAARPSKAAGVYADSRDTARVVAPGADQRARQWHGGETGSLLYGRGGPEPPTSSGGPERFTGAGKAGSRLPMESGVGAALWGGPDGVAPTSRFESVSMAEARRGIGSAERPVTSAGYHTKDGGFVREQIYGCIRQLDAGTLTVRAFRMRLATLGVPTLPAVERLLVDYGSTGRASFPQFVRAFEDYFMTATLEEPAPTPSTSFPGRADAERSGAFAEEARRGKGRVTSHVPAAAQHHGNLLSWDDAAQETEEERRAMIRDGLRPGMKKRTDLYKGTETKNIVAWSERDESAPDIIGASRPHRVSRKGREAALAERTAGNFLAWASGDFADAPDAHVSGHIVDTHPDGTPFVRRKGRAANSAAYSTSTPFGTAVDVEHPPAVPPPRTSHSTTTSYNWMEHPENAGTLPRRGLR